MVYAGAGARGRSIEGEQHRRTTLYYIFALTLCLLSIRQGSHLTPIPNPPDLDNIIAVLEKRPFHMLPAVNTLFNALLVHLYILSSRRSTSQACSYRRREASLLRKGQPANGSK